MSEIRANTVSDAAGTGPVTLTGQSAAKAWIDWAALPATVVGDSLNVSSLTDNATGSFDVNYTNNLSGANYSTSGNQAFNTDVTNYIYMVQPRNNGTVLAGSCGVHTKYAGSAASSIGDYHHNSLTIHGDLA